MTAAILVRYGEIALKGKNRMFFEKTLLENIKFALKGLGARVVRMHGRLLIMGAADEEEEITRRLSRVFGVVSVSSVETAPLDLEAIKEKALEIMERSLLPGDSFKVEARRSNKSFPLTSPELNRIIGGAILEKYPRLKVDLENPSFQLFIEVGAREAYIYHDHVAGPGGLPVGSSGRALLLLSGGIDSPVAGWMAMKRGLRLEALHFHSYPFTGLRSREKVIDLCRILSRYGGKMQLHLVNVAGIQKEIRASCPAALGIILLRRMMMRIAGQISRSRGLQALVTGESLGQVASQTLESMIAIDSVTSMLILRPLLGMDKHEIVALAEKTGTYEISIRPYEDCCTLFLPRHPATRPRLEKVVQAEAALDAGGLTAAALENMETMLIED
ncbi:MAG TPA: tRNA uracil 4-sulfurtransferase ThiI [Bacillota bacterium]|jgi:thiamine biosynthesis protein ThiI|nr:tRNA 4-thiouridine(8) synthase ThiI [Bacillota bacterium]HOA35293.1 tRNA uracil 4-sulfurtransferase ThiI [Bacillota bacterium]HOJ83495.1 tRNA uracil 4-sulfurtransferase ThiI [Bacillota bacterium]HOL14827.1 tRNA uracil 4-sulfurtransferase ThiI [Bacillota bacterium]HPZ11277.1 tRNA uracil 4-sulfurtransferase ThiI [Bacillota bacterium]